MRIVRDTASLPDLDPDIRNLIQQRVDELGSDVELATFVVMEPGDALEALDARLGFSVLSDRVSGRRFGEPGFCPAFESVESHSDCYEMTFVLADYGDGVIVIVPKRVGVDRRLLSLCEAYATTA